MTSNTQFIYDTPHREVASVLNDLYCRSTSASFISGFITPEGIEAVARAVEREPTKLSALVVGAGTWRAYDAFDRLLNIGVSPAALRVHLGHSRPTRAGAKHAFYRYHPMLHSKVYLFEMECGEAAAFVGSHNMTGFALYGLNGEAGVLLTGALDCQPVKDIRRHITEAISSSTQYDPDNREAYAWWAGQFMEGLASKFRDLPTEGEAKNTLVILAEARSADAPASDDVIYLELPRDLRLQSLRAEVHVYLYDTLPKSPAQALRQLATAKKSIWCVTIGIEDDRGGKELQAQWRVNSIARPTLTRVPRPFRPSPAPDMQQVRIRTRYSVHDAYEYLFDPAKPTFQPVFDQEAALTLSPELARHFEALKIVPPEHLPWFRVTGIRKAEVSAPDDPYHAVLRRLTPGEGSFILISRRRRLREP